MTHTCLAVLTSLQLGLLSSMHSTKYISAVSSRGVTHGLSLLGVFIYKYLADTSFVTVSCRTSAQGFVSQQMATNVLQRLLSIVSYKQYHYNKDRSKQLLINCYNAYVYTLLYAMAY